MKESFQNWQNESTATNHTVNIPLNQIYDCTNKCSPNNICYKTGEQCFSDIDCNGCENLNIANSISLPPAQPFKGVDIWTNQFRQDYAVYNAKYKVPDDFSGLIHYPERLTLSGEFENIGPIESNEFI
jgi:hypothetical protein